MDTLAIVIAFDGLGIMIAIFLAADMIARAIRGRKDDDRH